MAQLLHRAVGSALFLICVCPLRLFAVDPGGEIAGTVYDPSGAVVPRAEIVASDPASGFNRSTTTGDAGTFALPLLPPSIYTITVSHPGFRSAVIQRVTVQVDQTFTLNVSLEIGPLKEEAMVSGSAPLVDTANAQLGYVVDERPIQELPLNERNFLQFALLVPGVHSPADGSQNIGTGGSFSVNGAREQSNNFLLDGADNNDPFVNEFSVLPPVDAIEEFKVQTLDSSAEFGRVAGAQINVVLKSGSNTFHGDAFELVRNRHLDARNFFDLPACRAGILTNGCGSIPRLDRSQFGGSLGGPIVQNHTFVFLSYEGLLLNRASTRQATVPSQAQRAAALAGVPTAKQNPAGLAALNLYPAANVGANLFTSNVYASQPVLHETNNEGIVKIDQQLTARDTLSGHYATYRQQSYNPFNQKFIFTNLPGYGSNSVLQSQNGEISWNRAITPTLVNSVRAAFNRHASKYVQQGSGVDEAASIGFPATSANPLNWGYPNIAITGFDGIGTAIILPQQFISNTFEYADDGVWTAFAGRHEIHFGTDIRRIQQNFYLNALSRGEFFFLGAFTKNPLKDLIAGLPTVAVAVAGDSHTWLRTTSADFYLQDNYRVTPNFSLDLGLRYDYNQPPTDIYNGLSVPDFSADSATCSPKPNCQFIQAGTHGVPRATYSGTAGDFGPRAGFAWKPFASERLVVRSAYGVFFDEAILNVNILPHSNPPFYDVATFANKGAKNIQSIVNFSAAVPAPPQSVYVSPNFRDGYLQQWHFTLDGQLSQNLVLSAGYVGSKGTHLADQRQYNQPQPGGIAPYPQFGPMRFIAADGNSSYHALNLSAQKRARNFQFIAAYTWGRSIDNTSALFNSQGDPGFPQNSSNLAAERGLSDFHVEHRFVLSGFYDLPLRPFAGNSLLNAVLGGWHASAIGTAQTGQPFTVNRGISQSGTGTTIGFFDRPNQIANPMTAGPVLANPNPLCHATISHGGLAADQTGTPSSWFNACAFAAPSPLSFGNAGRNTVIGPGFDDIDLALRKEMKLTERSQLQISGEFFNVLNHPNFDLPDRNFDSSTFTHLRSANAYGNKPPRQIQLGLRLQF